MLLLSVRDFDCFFFFTQLLQELRGVLMIGPIALALVIKAVFVTANLPLY
jgi:hypothetical protein